MWDWGQLWVLILIFFFFLWLWWEYGYDWIRSGQTTAWVGQNTETEVFPMTLIQSTEQNTKGVITFSSDLLQTSFLERGISEVEPRDTQYSFHKIFPPLCVPSGSACSSKNQTTTYCIDKYYHATKLTKLSTVQYILYILYIYYTFFSLGGFSFAKK